LDVFRNQNENMSIKKIEAEEFLKLAESFPVIDVRSPKEYITGHIPGAVNIPIFDDNERIVVGTKYKKEGRIPAIIEGLKLTGPSMSSKLELALKSAGNGKLLVHCWRGGMRSEAMAWLFSLGGIETEVLEGGYKSYRNYILNSLSEQRKIGTVFIPDSFYLNMQNTWTIVLMMDVRTRLPRLMEEYSTYPAESLKTAILKISKRLGGDNTRDALKAVEDGNIARAIEITLCYYDKAYMFGLKKKSNRNLIYVETDSDDIEINALKILDAAQKIVW
jgi:tRNA 2-selenouridine synthase SelU